MAAFNNGDQLFSNFHGNLAKSFVRYWSQVLFTLAGESFCEDLGDLGVIEKDKKLEIYRRGFSTIALLSTERFKPLKVGSFNYRLEFILDSSFC